MKFTKRYLHSEIVGISFHIEHIKDINTIINNDFNKWN